MAIVIVGHGRTRATPCGPIARRFRRTDLALDPTPETTLRAIAATTGTRWLPDAHPTRLVRQIRIRGAPTHGAVTRALRQAVQDLTRASRRAGPYVAHPNPRAARWLGVEIIRQILDLQLLRHRQLGAARLDTVAAALLPNLDQPRKGYWSLVVERTVARRNRERVASRPQPGR